MCHQRTKLENSWTKSYDDNSINNAVIYMWSFNHGLILYKQQQNNHWSISNHVFTEQDHSERPTPHVLVSVLWWQSWHLISV